MMNTDNGARSQAPHKTGLILFAGRGMLPRPKRFTLFMNPDIAKTLGTGLQTPSRLVMNTDNCTRSQAPHKTGLI